MHLRFGYGFDMRNPKAWYRPWADLYAETIEAFCMQAPAGFPLARLAEHAELFARKVMPAFRWSSSEFD